ncbi:MAG: hypothetical protein JSW03_06880 [Candidatus Eiseniibacteriota bacterium]|nr:MAG: hypothetical protein JSW03_06880 [Candidatus Eisenbacteria bacterium]
MTKLFYIAIATVVALGLAVPAAWASVPSVDNSTVLWVNLVNDTTAMICPTGDASYLDVTVKDQFNAPMAGVLVEASFDGAEIYLVSPVSGTTDISGHVNLMIYGGTDNSAGEQTVTSGTEVTCLGVTLYSNDKDFLSPDMSQAPGSENVVEALDYGIFAVDWLSFEEGSRSNFNRLCNEAGGECVGGLDYSIFAAHWLH